MLTVEKRKGTSPAILIIVFALIAVLIFFALKSDVPGKFSSLLSNTEVQNFVCIVQNLFSPERALKCGTSQQVPSYTKEGSSKIFNYKIGYFNPINQMYELFPAIGGNTYTL